MRRLAAVLLAVALSPAFARAQEPRLSIFKENYFISGMPLNTRPEYDTSDLSYQISVRFNILQDVRRSGWDVFWGYTQLSIWDVYKPSNPFRENTYMNGLYASNDRILTGYEHRSNGRDGHDSRSLDYAFLSYTQPLGKRFALQATGRFGIGSIGNDFSLEMFKRYQGFFNAAIGYKGERLRAKLSVTPLMADIPANVTAELAWNLMPRGDGFYLTAQYHYGYDEAQIDSGTPGVFLKHMLRFGLSIQPSRMCAYLFY